MARQKESLFFRIFSSKIFFLLVFIFSIYMGLSLYKDLNQRKKIKNEISNLQSQIQGVDKQNSELKNLISYFETDEYIEEFSREKLGLKKPGEQIIVLPNDDLLNVDPQNKEENSGLKIYANLKLWWNYFFNSKKN